MITYTPTPDYYQDYIEHGWLKDQAAKIHKYIKRWRGKNGKWNYAYSERSADSARRERFGSKRTRFETPNGKSAYQNTTTGAIRNALDHETFLRKFQKNPNLTMYPNGDPRNKSYRRKKTRQDVHQDKKKRLGL